MPAPKKKSSSKKTPRTVSDPAPESTAAKDVAEPIVDRGRARAKESDRPTALGSPGTVAPALPAPSTDGFIQALVSEAEASGWDYSVIVRDEADAETARKFMGNTHRTSVRMNRTLRVRATWRRQK